MSEQQGHGEPGQHGRPGQPGPYGAASGYGGPYQGYQGYPGQGPAPEMSPSDQRLWSALTHAGGILFFFLAPLVGHLVLRDRGVFVREQTREALNFQITLAIAYVAATIVAVITFGLLSFLPLLVWVADVVLSVVAAVRAGQGFRYRYPATIRFVR